MAQVIINTWLFVQLGRHGWFGAYNWRCQPLDKSADPQSMQMAEICYYFYLNKFLDLSDTAFFVLGKKMAHVSLLHVVHHGLVPMSLWVGVRFSPGGHGSLFALLNTFVHAVMYSYYLLAAFGPSMRRFLWWKKYLTRLQMVQFIVFTVHALQLFFIDCDYHVALAWLVIFHGTLFLALFARFYRHSYHSKGRPSHCDPLVAVNNNDGKVD